MKKSPEMPPVMSNINENASPDANPIYLSLEYYASTVKITCEVVYSYIKTNAVIATSMLIVSIACNE